MLYTKGLLMPSARYRDDAGRYVIVQLPETKLQSGAVHYDEKIHKGKLICRSCEAGVHYHPGSKTISGDNFRGPREHFASNRQKDHSDECTVELILDEGREPREYDLTKGYRLHLNTGDMRQQFAAHSRFYGRRSHPHWKIMINDPDLADREAFSIKSAENFQRLMGRKQHHRMRRAIVIHGGAEIPWKDFFIRYTHKQGEKKRYSRRQPRFTHLADTLAEKGNDMLVMMEFDLTTPKYAGRSFKAEGRRIKESSKDEDGYRREIVPWVVPTGDRQYEIANKLADKDRYLVMGRASLKVRRDAHTKKDYFYITVEVDSPDWVTKADLGYVAKLTPSRKMPSSQFPLSFS